MPSDTPTLDFAAHWVLFAVLAAVAFVFVRRARRSPSRGRLVLGNVLVLATLLGGALACGETYMRFVFDASSWHAEALTTRVWLRRHCKLNKDGFRDADFAREKRPGTARVVFLGDSFTFGYGIADAADRFTDRIDAALEQRSPGKFDVWNVGEIGANTAMEIRTLRRLLANVQLDRVVLSYSPNDVEDLLPLDRHDVAPFEGARPGSLRAHSFLIDHLVIRSALLDTSGAEKFYDAVGAIHRDAALWARQQARIAAFARLCRDAGLRLDVVVWPLISHWGPDYPFDAWHDRIDDTWKAQGVTVVDLREVFRGLTSQDLRVNALDAHPNERASALVAAELVQRLF